jgi:hypothetical protein
MIATDWDTAWAGALATLELDVEVAERILAGDHLPTVEEIARLAAWRVPTDVGPLPASLSDRARALLDRQLAAAAAVGRAMTMNRRHLAAVDALHAAPAPRPVYVDIEG